MLTTSTSGWVPASTVWHARALAAAALRALQRRREGPRGGGPAGPGRAGEQPGVRHAGAGLAAPAGLRQPPRPRAQHGDGGLLADQVDPDPAGCLGHRSSRRWSTRGQLEGAVVVLVVGPDAEQLVGQGQRAGRRVVGGRRSARRGVVRPVVDVVTATRVAMALLAGQPLLLLLAPPLLGVPRPAARACCSRTWAASAAAIAASRARSAASASSWTPALLGQRPLPRRRPGPAGPLASRASCRARSSASARARASSSRRASSAIRRRSSSAARACLGLADLQRAQRQHRLEPGPDRRGDLARAAACASTTR